MSNRWITTNRDRIADLELRLARRLDSQLPNSSTCLVVGSSLIRDITSCDTERVQIHCIGGAKIVDVTKELSSQKDKFDTVSLVVGGNDCDTVDATPASISNDIKQMIDAAKKVGNNVKVSSILPRIKPKCLASQLNIEKVNQTLKNVCSADPMCEYVDHNNNFCLADKSPNDALFLADGVHLNQKGSEKLISNLGLNDLVRVQNFQKRRHNGLLWSKKGNQRSYNHMKPKSWNYSSFNSDHHRQTDKYNHRNYNDGYNISQSVGVLNVVVKITFAVFVHLCPLNRMK